jgi:hypothetical protein
MFPGMDDDVIARLGLIVTGDGSREERALPAADLVRRATGALALSNDASGDPRYLANRGTSRPGDSDRG